MVGIIDEIRMPASEPKSLPILVDTKTRVRATLPSEPQRRNGRYMVTHVNWSSDFSFCHLSPLLKSLQNMFFQVSINVLQAYLGQFGCSQISNPKVL